VTLREVVARLEEFADEEPIYAESASPTARAVVGEAPGDEESNPEARFTLLRV
jgi:hypothetical protein